MTNLILILPLFAAIVTGLSSRRISDSLAQSITSLSVAISALISIKLFIEFATTRIAHEIVLFNWLNFGNLNFDWSFKIDSLTATMLVVVTSVSTIVHLYSIGYMSHDKHKPRFMAYLSLFTFFMLMLVTANNLIQLFLGWEGVGLCSYLLIGFWFKKESANNAAMKAFIVNRVGDFAFALGIFLIYQIFQSVQFAEIFSQIDKFTNHETIFLGQSFNSINLICVLLFIGSMGKSAQIGLHTWLPDAMEGPTPVSALIHAATMVTAGVFLVARCSPLFEHAEIARHLITIIGAITCIFAATIAITQNDIKKIIAYSTCSQLGYMFFACGVSAYGAGVFHLMTHAFFKALLFLGAGCVIHAMSDEQDIRKMGGIWKKIPMTYALMWIGSLALAGVYPFAGFFSKDMILEAAYASNAPYANFAFIIGLLVAFLTALYSWRLIIMVFHGHSNATKEVQSKIHESPKIMLVPLFVLAIGAIFSGMFGSASLKMVSHENNFFRDAISLVSDPSLYDKAHHVPTSIKLLPAIAGFLGIAMAYILYYFFPTMPEKIANSSKFIYKTLLNKYYIDELYDNIFVAPMKKFGTFCSHAIDQDIVDKYGPNGFARFSKTFAGRVQKFHNGIIYSYAYIMLIGLLIIITWLIFY